MRGMGRCWIGEVALFFAGRKRASIIPSRRQQFDTRRHITAHTTEVHAGPVRLRVRPERLGTLRFASYPFGNPHPELRLVAYRLRSRDVFRGGDLFGRQAQ